MKRVRSNLRRADGTPWPLHSVLIHVRERICDASLAGRGLSFTAEEVRALDWAVIRAEGCQGDFADMDRWRDGSIQELTMEQRQP